MNTAEEQQILTAEQSSRRIDKIKIKGFKKFIDYIIEFKDGINILIGENESGKSTILDAINVVLNQRYNNFDKYIVEDLLNRENIKKFEQSKNYADLPKIEIEAYLTLTEKPSDAEYFGFHHSDNPTLKDEQEHHKYGIRFKCEFDKDFEGELLTTIQEGKIPYDYYRMSWTTFRADSPYKIQKKPLKVLSIDNSSHYAASAYEYYNKSLYLNNYEKKDIMSHKGKFRDAVKQSFNSLNIPEIQTGKRFGLNQKKLIIENILTIFEQDISIENMGKGKENIIKIVTSLNKDSNKSDIILIEEPENHLSHMNLRYIIEYINKSAKYKQIIVTTHNNLIVRQSDISKLIIVDDNAPKNVADFDEETKYFFRKSDDYNLLQFLLSKKCILVEGRTEYILINEKYSQILGEKTASLDSNKIDVISCYGKVFKHYIKAANGLDKIICIITDNDSDEEKIEKHKDYSNKSENIKIFCDQDANNRTFEISFYKLNEEKLKTLIKTKAGAKYEFWRESFEDRPVLGYMLNNKADVAYMLFHNVANEFTYPNYIKEALTWIRS